MMRTWHLRPSLLQLKVPTVSLLQDSLAAVRGISQTQPAPGNHRAAKFHGTEAPKSFSSNEKSSANPKASKAWFLRGVLCSECIRTLEVTSQPSRNCTQWGPGSRRLRLSHSPSLRPHRIYIYIYIYPSCSIAVYHSISQSNHSNQSKQTWPIASLLVKQDHRTHHFVPKQHSSRAHGRKLLQMCACQDTFGPMKRQAQVTPCGFV